MKVHVLLRTRDRESDYRWFYKPSYIDKEMEDKMSFLMQMMHSSDRYEYLFNESLHNIYYIHGEKGSVLIRGVMSGNMDMHGRNIYAIEGIACTAEQNRQFWYALPYLIDRISNIPLLRDRWIDEQRDRYQAEDRQIMFSSLSENSLFVEKNDAVSYWHQMQEKSDCMDRLMSDIHHSAEMFDFVYGTRNKDFYGLSNYRYYTPEILDCQEEIVEKTIDTYLNPVLNENDRTYKISLQIDKTSKGYEVFLAAFGKNNEQLAETDAIPFGREGVSLARIEAAKLSLAKELEKLGYVRQKKS